MGSKPFAEANVEGCQAEEADQQTDEQKVVHEGQLRAALNARVIKTPFLDINRISTGAMLGMPELGGIGVEARTCVGGVWSAKGRRGSRRLSGCSGSGSHAML